MLVGHYGAAPIRDGQKAKSFSLAGPSHIVAVASFQKSGIGVAHISGAVPAGARH